ncbi:uncharacterized protein EI90DRAFT_3043894 [Cantharellus anzutake]|uniref:uncharacterized protein n=1 Tax=Cantharellus anzutake TaxID=1750568 RepID=UPI00190888E1|nr:uncharacterized protein EI90DRAFT_3043894 [Cantharellus anzutake]KAF8336862.1 hypothetical protein EI90DRAFT_3043894 [Cantharellus anzutake]
MAHFERMESSPTPPNSSTVGAIPDIIERRTQVLRSAAKLSRSISTRIKATAGSILPNGSSSESPSSSSKFASTSFSPSGRDSSILVASTSTGTGTGTGTGSSPPTSSKGKDKNNNKDKYPVYTSPIIKKSPPSVTSSIKHITSSFSLTRHGRSKSDTASSSSPFAIMPAAAESLLSPTTQTSRPQFDHPSGLGSGGGPPVSGNPIAESGSEGGGGGGGSNSIVRRRSFRHEQYPRSQQDHHHQPVSPPPRLVKAAGHDITSDASVDEAELKVPALLQTGTPMLKMRMFRLDPDLGQVIWESNRYGVLPIEHIKEIRTGPETSYHREQLRLSADYEPRWISLVYARDGKYKILHMVSLSDDVFRMWNVILRKLFSLRQELMSGLGDANAEVRQRVWEKLYWKGADSTGDAKLDFQEVERMCRRLNIATPRSELLNCFMQADSQSRGFLDFADFRHFVKLLRARPDIAAIYDDAMGDSPEFTFEVFERFMRESQKSTLSKEELLRIYAKYGRPRYISMPNTPLVMPAEIKGEDELPGEGEEAVRDGANDQREASAASPITSLATAVLATASTLAPKLLVAPELPKDSQTGRQTKIPEAAPHELPGESIKFSGDNSATVVSPTDVDPTPTEPPPLTIPPTPTPDSPTPPWSLSTFEAFLHSTDNSPFGDNPDDMTRPLSEYYISASHNTYLVGHQLVGDSTIEGYIRALLHGCRSVELDIWDGDDGPAIFHGHTLTTKVSLQDVVRAIARYAFVASPYPVVISAEIHCCLEQQDMAAEIMRKEFGSALVDEPVNGEEKGNIVTLPSPEALKGRILFKAKNAFLTTTLTAEPEEAREGGVDVDVLTTTTEEVSSSDVEQKKGLGKEVKEEISHEVSRAKGLMRRMRGKLKGRSTKSSGGDGGGGGGGGGNVEKPKPKMSLALAALLVYTVGIKCRGLNKKETYAVEHVFSLSERMADKVMRESMADLIKHNRTHVIRVYPSGTRLSSTNYEPHRYWASGAQLVAINFQTFDLGYIMNYAMFMRNGRLGYVLKPAALRLKDKQMASRRTKHFLDVTIISAQQLPHPKEGSQGRDIDTKRTIDPYVEVSLHVPEWSISPFLPDQNARRSSPPHNGSSSSSSSSNPSSARTVSYVTSVVKDNGFNPVWKETMAIPFDCVGDMRELIFVRFQVKDEHGHDDLGVYCVSLASLLPGYRHLPLHDKQMSQYLFSTLFIHTIIRDVTD